MLSVPGTSPCTALHGGKGDPSSLLRGPLHGVPASIPLLHCQLRLCLGFPYTHCWREKTPQKEPGGNPFQLLLCRARKVGPSLQGQSLLWALQVPAEQRDSELPQLPPLVHEARLCVRPPATTLPPSCSPRRPTAPHTCFFSPLPSPASLYFAVYRKINHRPGVNCVDCPLQGPRVGDSGGKEVGFLRGSPSDSCCTPPQFFILLLKVPWEGAREIVH